MLKNNLDFKHIDKIIKNGLTNTDYYRVLGTIGESEEPLTNSQIFQKYEEKYNTERKNNKYIYQILIDLSPPSKNITDKLLFIWEDLTLLELEQLEEKCHDILQKINQSFDFKIDNHLKENYLILMDGNSLKDSNKWIIIQKNNKNSETFNPYFDEDIIIMMYDKFYDKSNCHIFPILTIKKKGKIYVYSKSYTSLEGRQFLDTITEKQINFLYTPGQKNENTEKNDSPRTHQLLKESLDMTLSMSSDEYLQQWFLKQYGEPKKENLQNNERFSKEQNSMKILYEKTYELNKIIGDREYFRYALNFKGLLLFLILYGSIKKTRIDELLFNKVLSNPLLLGVAPFLAHLDEFDKAGFKGKELVVTIAEELRNQLHLAGKSGTILFERVIERYLKEFHEYFKEYEISFRSQSLKNSVNPEGLEEFDKLLKKIYFFRKKMITILIEIIQYKEEYYLDIPDEPYKVQIY